MGMKGKLPGVLEICTGIIIRLLRMIEGVSSALAPSVCFPRGMRGGDLNLP